MKSRGNICGEIHNRPTSKNYPILSTKIATVVLTLRTYIRHFENQTATIQAMYNLSRRFKQQVAANVLAHVERSRSGSSQDNFHLVQQSVEKGPSTPIRR
ncbi:hypothetical protein AVEN_133720-1 [Araneus ventricosus]|uniref:Uncharacterized protein n=1 Tax=Araneus ventricosus TaxID=182803 RepID=A0A4Y2B7M5_ARAVE|nr:hypothetical protein AVEN_133720-1 [Araneus ventricosus]